jgi:hypothetical protein
VSSLTPDQRRTRDRVESVISLAAPFLNLVLSFGERMSRIVEPEDSEYYPVRSSLIEGDGAKKPEPETGGAPAGD